MKKIIVNVKTISDHFHDMDLQFDDGKHRAFDMGVIMAANYGYADVDEYDDLFEFIYDGKKCNYSEVMGWEY